MKLKTTVNTKTPNAECSCQKHLVRCFAVAGIVNILKEFLPFAPDNARNWECNVNAPE